MSDTVKETIGFEAEVDQLLHLMVHSLYSNKEIFLRELISNASDAAKKLRYDALSNADLYENDSDLKIWISFDKEAKSITIKDNGIGMSRDEVIQNLGTIAKSGTKEFINSLTGDKTQDADLIGKFGVGFYASFIVADKVIVTTRRAGIKQEEAVRWSSEGKGDYSLENVFKPERGTEIILYLKDEEDEFLNSWRLRNIITKYSDHISIPVLMAKEPTEAVSEEGDDTEAKVIDAVEDEVVNDATALWTLPKNDIEEDKYKEFYKKLAQDYADPLTWAHNKVEGKLDYTSLIYIPSTAPYDLWNIDKPRGLKLFVKRVFIMDDAEQFVPNYLRFIRGLIDTDDLPLNISREILQKDKKVDGMRTAVTKRVLSMLSSLANNDSDKYQTFWQQFGQVLKEGPAEDFANKEAIAKLLRFSSTNTDEEKQTVSLEDYISRMKEGQETIYYITADTFNAVKNSPHLEVFRNKDIEVLLLSSKVDEWLMSHLTEFDSKKFQSIAKGNLDGKEFKSENESEDDNVSDESKDTIARIKEALSSRVKDVRVSKRLTSSPSCIVADENDMSAQMERIMQAAGQKVDKAKPILEINPKHLLIEKINKESDSDKFKEWSNMLLDQAILAEGGQLEEPASFVRRFNDLLLELAGK